ncbi:MAG TPA: methyltransferase domain-containing protein, partial [Pyrinomonadaceae bacterium]|nr:methyltransferase domain-containing protein [Pyrinomonadaceae bacterium]
AARKSLYYSDGRKRDVTFTQGNLLSLPIADESLDLVVTSGALEYVPLGDGLTELARVIAPGGHLLHFPVHPGSRVFSSRYCSDSRAIHREK